MSSERGGRDRRTDSAAGARPHTVPPCRWPKDRDRVDMTEVRFPDYESPTVKTLFSAGHPVFEAVAPIMRNSCDIQGLYGRNPGSRRAEITAETRPLARMRSDGLVYFVDDNLSATRKAALDLLPHMSRWQKKKRLRMRLAARRREHRPSAELIAEKCRGRLLRYGVLRIEHTGSDALKAMHKDHQYEGPITGGDRRPSIATGWRSSPASMGLDTDKPRPARRCRLCR